MKTTKRKSAFNAIDANAPIPQKYYLRKVIMGSKAHNVILYVFWSFRNKVKNVIQTKSRRVAMNQIRAMDPAADFFRAGKKTTVTRLTRRGEVVAKITRSQRAA